MIHLAKVKLKITYLGKLHNTSAIISFMKKTLVNDVISKFEVIKGQFISEVNSLTVSRKLMKSNLTEHVQDLYDLSM